MLTVEEKTDQRHQRYVVWRCRCECGNEILLDTPAILRGAKTDCGCRTKHSTGAKDLTGQRFGKLTAIEPTDKREDQGSIVWRCLCDCGNEKEVSARRLIRGKVRSCGCLSNPPLKDYVGKRFGRLTVIEYAGKRSKTNRENFWKCQCDCGNEIITGQTGLQSGETQSCGCYMKDRVRDGLKLADGTSARIIESSLKKPRSDNKSGYPGVFQEKSGMWTAKITFRKKQYWLGRYRDKEDAIKARKRGEEMFDEFLEWYYNQYPDRKPSGKATEL